MSDQAAIDIQGLSHRYGDHRALDDVSFSVKRGELFGLLGPNGGGKTTLFRILSTLLPVQSGSVSIFSRDVVAFQDVVRSLIGVVFQSPSLDGKLTVGENLKHQGHLYGLRGDDLKRRIDRLLNRLGIADRQRDRVESLSGGLQRRVEIAKGLLHDPQLLLLDEPSTGLDPGARSDLWKYLKDLRAADGVTAVVTTHLMEEAENCDRLGILDGGRIAAVDTPTALRARVGGDCLTIETDSPEELAKQINERFQLQPQTVDGRLRIERERGHDLVRELVEAFPESVKTISLGKPTLQDVFIQLTGHRFWREDES